MTKPKAKLKKTDSDKEGSSSGTGSDPKAGDGPPSSSPGSSSQKQRETPTAWFTSEIQAMMHGFGDCQQPLFESARLIEEIVHQQMNSMLLQLADIASARGVRFIGPEEVVFLLRKDKVKLTRLIRYLTFKDMKTSICKGAEDILQEETGDHGTPDVAKVTPSPVKKRVKICYDFLSTIDQTGELTDIFEEDVYDEVKHEREARAESMTRLMDTNQYLEYAEARRATFARKHRQIKFRDWILKDNLTDIKPNQSTLEILNYLAYETVAQIVDLALLVKQDANASADNPLSKITCSQSINPGFPSVSLHQFNKASSTTASPPQSPRVSSPPPSPSGTSVSAASSTASSSHPSPGSSTATKAKPKAVKRKKSEANAIVVEVPGSQVIQPSDIREAIRRYWQPVGPMFAFSKANSSFLGQRLLCC